MKAYQVKRDYWTENGREYGQAELDSDTVATFAVKEVAEAFAKAAQAWAEDWQKNDRGTCRPKHDYSMCLTRYTYDIAYYVREIEVLLDMPPVPNMGERE